MERFDTVVVGGGIVGLATAAELLRRRPGSSVAVLEKEPVIASHQTGRNSGVIHSGIYYRPGSLKATLVAEGRDLLFAACERWGVPVDRCGKLIVATTPAERARLDDLAERGAANGLAVEPLGPAGISEVEPHATGIAALRVPEAAIVDYKAVAAALADDLVAGGGALRLGARVTGLVEEPDGVVVTTAGSELRAGTLVNCGGLHTDRLARMMAPTADLPVIVPFRGEYYELTAERRDLVRHLLYPVPDPAFPFLGVHFTRMMDGSVHAGPNAVLALAREGYRWRDIVPADARGTLAHAGFRRFARGHARTGAGEMVRSVSKRAFVSALRRLVPELTRDDLVRSGAGVRAQAMAPDGTLLDDFAFFETARSVHVLNAPSPAATASLAIARYVADRAMADR